jgi:hypothetical protein
MSSVTPLPTDRLATAVAFATTRVPVAPPDRAVDDLLRDLRGRTFDSAAAVAVCVDDRLVGVATLERVLAAPDGAVLADVMDPTRRWPPRTSIPSLRSGGRCSRARRESRWSVTATDFSASSRPTA